MLNPFRKNSSLKLPRDTGRVLVIMTDHHLGNAVIAMPVVAALAGHFTNGIDLLLDERHVELYKLLQETERIKILRYPAPGSSRLRAMRHVKPTLVTLSLWPRRYRVVIDLSTGIRSTTITLATLSRVRLGFRDVKRAWSYSHKIDAPRDAHILDRFARVLSFLDPPPEHQRVQLRPPREGFDQLDTALQTAFGRTLAPDAPGARLAVIHPSSGKVNRRWPAERFAAVADHLVAEHDLSVCLIGVPSERGLAEAILERMAHRDRARFFVLPLVQLLALFHRAAVLVSNESGPTHLAATTGVPIVTIFGPTRESLWRPSRDESLTILRGSPCDPGCGRSGCVADLKCLNDLTADQVIQAVRSTLKSKSAFLCRTYP